MLRLLQASSSARKLPNDEGAQSSDSVPAPGGPFGQSEETPLGVPAPPVSGVDAGKSRGGRPRKEPVDEAHARRLEADRERKRKRRDASLLAEFSQGTNPENPSGHLAENLSVGGFPVVENPPFDPGKTPLSKPENPRASEITSSLSESGRPLKAFPDSLPSLVRGAENLPPENPLVLTHVVVTQRRDDAIRQARATYLAVVKEILGASWHPPAGVAFDDAAVTGLCKFVRTLPGSPADRRDLGGFLVALRGHVERFVRARWHERHYEGRYDPQEALAWLERPARPSAPPPPARRPSSPPKDEPKGPQPGRDTTPPEWAREDRATRKRMADEFREAYERATARDRAPGLEKYEENVAFNGASAFWAASPAIPTPEEDTTMPVDEPLDDPMAYDPPAEPEAPLTPLEAQEAIELDELREVARAAQDRHRRQVAEIARIEKERAEEAAAAMLSSLRTLAEQNPDARLAPSYGVEVKRVEEP